LAKIRTYLVESRIELVLSFDLDCDSHCSFVSIALRVIRLYNQRIKMAALIVKGLSRRDHARNWVDRKPMHSISFADNRIPTTVRYFVL